MPHPKPSSYAVAKRRLVAWYSEHPTLRGKVSYGTAGRGAEREQIEVLASPGEADDIWATIGNQAREEQYDIVVDIDVANPGYTQREATERCEELFAAVEEQTRAWLDTQRSPDQEAARAGIHSAQIARVRREEFEEGDGRGASTTCIVRITARKKP
jgi:hypothetical protein